MFPRIKDSGLVFGLDTATPDLIICEGEFDAMSMRSKGFTGSIATGSCQVSEKQVNNIIKKAERITILFDPDEAGLEGANKLTDLLYGTVPVRIGLLGSSDPAETSAEELQEIVKKAKTPLEFKEYIKKNKE
jgi:DNA primase